MNAQVQPTPEQQAAQAAQEAMQEMPIVLSLTLRKANYILNILAKLPYEQSFQPIADIQQMVVAQVQAAQAQAQADAAAAVAAAQAPADAPAAE